MDTKKCGRFKVYKPTVDDIVFDSGLEARYYIYLIELMNRGIVDNFERQQSFTLQPGFTLGEKRIRAITYIADFVVTYRNGDVEVIDVKGRETPDFKLKKKLFMYVFRLPLFCVQYYNGEWRTLDDIKKLKRGT